MTNAHQQQLNRILHYGIVEIRILADRKNEGKRIFDLANILHNIPNALLGKDFDFLLLRQELQDYQKKYKDDCINFLKLLDE